MDKEKLFEVAEEMWPTNKDLPPYHWVNTEAKRKQRKWLDGALWTLTILQSRLSECERERDEWAIGYHAYVKEKERFGFRTGDAYMMDGYKQFKQKQSLKSENNGNEGAKD